MVAQQEGVVWVENRIQLTTSLGKRLQPTWDRIRELAYGSTALVGAVVGTAGLAGLALGFAFKDIVENYLAGLLLALRQPFAQNDHVALGSH